MTRSSSHKNYKKIDDDYIDFINKYDDDCEPISIRINKTN